MCVSVNVKWLPCVNPDVLFLQNLNQNPQLNYAALSVTFDADNHLILFGTIIGHTEQLPRSSVFCERHVSDLCTETITKTPSRKAVVLLK